MSLRINTNMSALRSQRAIAGSTRRLSRNFERLATGSRINRAADDSAGLAISTRLTSRIRSMNQVIRNVNDGLSLTQVAASALSSSTEVVQRIRELAVQAASDTMGDNDRFGIQVEVNRLLDELDFISESTQFGGMTILDGGFNRFRLQVGDTVNDVVDIHLKAIDSWTLGRQARAEGFDVDTAVPILAEQISLNGVFVRPTNLVDDLFSVADIEGSALAKANAINAGTAFHGVSAEAFETYAIGQTPQGGILDDSNFIVINGELLTGFEVHLNDASDELIRQINAVEPYTGVIAETDEFNNLILRAPDGRNIEVVTGSVAAATATGLNGGAPGAQVTGGSLILKSANRIDLEIHEFEAETALGLGDVVGVHYFGLTEENSLSSASVIRASEANRTIELSDIAVADLSSMRSDIGALLSRLELAIASNESSRFHLTMSRSRIQDTDLAQEVVDLARNRIVRQAGISILSQANVGPEITMGLLSSHTMAMETSRTGFMSRRSQGQMSNMMTGRGSYGMSGFRGSDESTSILTRYRAGKQ